MKRMLAVMLMVAVLVTVGTVAGAVELTEEYLLKNGIPSVDERGNETLLIPLCTVDVTAHTPQVGTQRGHEDCFLLNAATTRRFSVLAHTHQMMNIQMSRAFKTFPITAWADEGFTISWNDGWNVTVQMNVNIVGGMPVQEAQRSLGAQIGGSYTLTSSASHTAPVVPPGYEGRISLRVDYFQYTFDDLLTYTFFGEETSTEYIQNNTAESAPLDDKGVLYLEVRKK